VSLTARSVLTEAKKDKLLAMRYNDIRNGTKIVDDVLEKYKAAWAEKGLINENGIFPEFYMIKQDHLMQTKEIGFTAW